MGLTRQKALSSGAAQTAREKARPAKHSRVRVCHGCSSLSRRFGRLNMHIIKESPFSVKLLGFMRIIYPVIVFPYIHVFIVDRRRMNDAMRAAVDEDAGRAAVRDRFRSMKGASPGFHETGASGFSRPACPRRSPCGCADSPLPLQTAACPLPESPADSAPTGECAPGPPA